MKTMLILMTLSGHTYMPMPYTPVPSPPSQDTLTPEDRAIPFRGAAGVCVHNCIPKPPCNPTTEWCSPPYCWTTCY